MPRPQLIANVGNVYFQQVWGRRKTMELHEAGQWRLHASRQVDSHAWPGARRRGDQVGIRCVFMRGGTSRGAFLHAADLPEDLAIREKLLLGMYGSPDIRQIDGLGGAHPLTSKVAIVGRSSRPDADVDFTFGQVCIDAPHVEFVGNCGNMAAAVGPFAIDAGLVTASEPVTCVRIHLTNTHTLLRVEVPVCHGLACVEGDAEVSGVPGTGARLLLDLGDVGGTLGKGLLPTGRTRDVLQTAGRTFEVSIVDAGNPIVFVRAAAFGLQGTELPSAFTPGVLAQMQAVRDAAAHTLGLRGGGDVSHPEALPHQCPDRLHQSGRPMRSCGSREPAWSSGPAWACPIKPTRQQRRSARLHPRCYRAPSSRRLSGLTLPSPGVLASVTPQGCSRSMRP